MPEPDTENKDWPEQKRCTACKVSKPRSEFYRRKQMADGLRSECKACDKQRRAEYARQHPDKEREIKMRHPEKLTARRRVVEAIKRGDLVKPDACEDCGRLIEDGRRLHGHHEDYSKPLEVDWLCTRCHGLRHRKERNERAMA